MVITSSGLVCSLTSPHYLFGRALSKYVGVEAREELKLNTSRENEKSPHSRILVLPKRENSTGKMHGVVNC